MDDFKAIDITQMCLQWYADTMHLRTTYVDAAKAAEILNVTRPRITQLVSEGRLHAVKLGKELYLPYKEIVFYDNSRKWEEITDMEGC